MWIPYKSYSLRFRFKANYKIKLILILLCSYIKLILQKICRNIYYNLLANLQKLKYSLISSFLCISCFFSPHYIKVGLTVFRINCDAVGSFVYSIHDNHLLRKIMLLNCSGEIVKYINTSCHFNKPNVCFIWMDVKNNFTVRIKTGYIFKSCVFLCVLSVIL